MYDSSAYVGTDAAGVREFGPPMFEEATQALLRQNLTRDELTACCEAPTLPFAARPSLPVWTDRAGTGQRH